MLKVGQWWARKGFENHARYKITKLEKHIVHYFYVWSAEKIMRLITSRLQWEFDVERGTLVPSEEPSWGKGGVKS